MWAALGVTALAVVATQTRVLVSTNVASIKRVLLDWACGAELTVVNLPANGGLVQSVVIYLTR